MAKADEIGKVTHYYDKAGVAVVELKKALKTGEEITIKRGETQFVQPVVSMQIEHEQVEKAKAGESIGLKVDEKVKPGAVVYRGQLGEEEKE